MARFGRVVLRGGLQRRPYGKVARIRWHELIQKHSRNWNFSRRMRLGASKEVGPRSRPSVPSHRTKSCARRSNLTSGSYTDLQLVRSVGLVGLHFRTGEHQLVAAVHYAGKRRLLAFDVTKQLRGPPEVGPPTGGRGPARILRLRQDPRLSTRGPLGPQAVAGGSLDFLCGRQRAHRREVATLSPGSALQLDLQAVDECPLGATMSNWWPASGMSRSMLKS